MSRRRERARTTRRRVARLLAAVAFGLVGLAPAVLAAPASADRAAPPATDGPPRVLLVELDGAVTPVMASYIRSGLDRAAARGYDVVALRIDTPGGLESSMRRIIRDVLDSPVPVVVWVGPPGARAASAGAMITLASHVAVMAPGTAIGAATPVGAGGGGDLDRKIIEDAAAFAESLARLRDRNVEFAVDSVREGRSVSAEEAFDIGAVEAIASSLEGALAAADGRVVEIGRDRVETVVRSADGVVDTYGMGFMRSVQQFLADPNLVFLLLSIGTLGIIYELASPGIGVGGVVGLAAILLALFGLAILPVNVVGLLFLGIAIALFVAEVLAPGVGLAAFGGAVMLVLASVFLVDDAPGLESSLAVTAPITVVTAVMVIIAGRYALRSRRAPVVTSGAGLYVGHTVTVVESRDRLVGFIEGAWWRLRPSVPGIRPGDTVRVDAVDGLDLVVSPVETSGDDGPAASPVAGTQRDDEGERS